MKGSGWHVRVLMGLEMGYERYEGYGFNGMVTDWVTKGDERSCG